MVKPNMTAEEIELLVIDMKLGNSQAFNKLYQHFELQMKRYAYFRVADLMTAEDLVQNVWCKVSHRINGLNDSTLFRSWLYRALRWEIIDWLRKQNRFPQQELFETDFAPITPDRELLDIPVLLKQLACEEREVVELYYLCDLSVHETALALNVVMGTVKSRLHRARIKLDEFYNDEESKDEYR